VHLEVLAWLADSDVHALHVSTRDEALSDGGRDLPCVEVQDLEEGQFCA
jgi:hypothetical protein